MEGGSSVGENQKCCRSNELIESEALTHDLVCHWASAGNFERDMRRKKEVLLWKVRMVTGSVSLLTVVV